jgi:outer membrane lipoprotein SlyB
MEGIAMDSIEPAAKKALHPLVATAAVAVIVVSVLGAIVLITDQVAAHRGSDAPAVAATDPSANPTPTQPVVPVETATAPSPAAKPAAPRVAAPKVVHPASSSPPKPSAVAEPAAPPPPPPGAAPGVPPDLAMAAPPAPPVCESCGIVAGVRAVKTPGQGGAAGVVAGGVVGGLVGHQFGKGTGKDVASILGVIGGAVAGHEVEKEVRATTHYEVDVRLDNGQLKTVGVPGDPGPIVGQRVRIENGQLVREAPPQS